MLGFCVNIPSCTSIAQISCLMVRRVGIRHWALGIEIERTGVITFNLANWYK